MNLAAHLRRNLVLFRDRPAIFAGASVLYTYGELANRVARLAGTLSREYGIKRGDSVALFMKNTPEYLPILYAVWHAGAVAVPINAKLHPKECLYILRNSGAKLCFATQDLAGALRDCVGDVAPIVEVGSPHYAGLYESEPLPLQRGKPDDLAWLFYTSGTTGQPKGVMLTHRNLMAMIMSYYGDVQGISDQDVLLHLAPLSHGSGLFALAYVAKGARNVIPDSGAFVIEEALDLIAHHPQTSVFLAPTMITKVLNSPSLERLAASHLKTVFYGGAPMYREDLLRALDVFGPKLIQLYGLGEAPMTITVLPKAMHVDDGDSRYLQRLSSAGLPHTDVEVRVVDAEGNDVPTGTQGEIVVAGDVVMAGYWRNPEATDATIKDGWLHTGDIGRFDEDGYLTLLDRSKDMIISGGANIYPREIEDVLLMDRSVQECAVVGRPHPEWGEEVVAFIVPRPDRKLDATALDRLCLEHIARFKRPKEYVEIAELPKNNYGKVRKTELREHLTGARSAAGRVG